jgi:hypothetical protein
MPRQERDDTELGALWLRQGRAGEYMTGSVNGVRVICFWNEKATPDNRQPQWRVKRALSPEERDQIAADEARR